MMKRMIALLLCICMLGSMPVYATDDVTEPTVPETSTAATEPSTTPEPSSQATEPSSAVTEPSSQATEPSVPVVNPTDPVQVDTSAGPAVGDKIYIKRGSKVYKSTSDTNGHTLILSYNVTIEAIEYDENGAPAWYKFSPAVEWLFAKYAYVKVENTSVTDPDVTTPTEPEPSVPECTCGAENGTHKEDCPLYVEMKEEQEFDGKKFLSEIPVVVSEAPAADVQKIEAMLPAATTSDNQDRFVYDISGQDQDDVTITVEEMLDTEKLDKYGRCFVDIYHLKDDGEIEILRGDVNWDGDVTFETDSFSTFYFLVQYYWRESDVVDTETGSLENGVYTLSIASAANVATILTECGVPDEFTITSVTPSSETVKDDAGNDVSWATISGSGNSTTVKLVEPFTGLRKLNVVTNNGTYVIGIAVPEVFYYLDGTDWCLPTTTVNFDNVGTESYGNRITNTDLLDIEDVSGGVVIYARPGMVLRFTTGWRWGEDEKHLYVAHQLNDGCWRWYSSDSNFVVINEDITEVTTFKIAFSQQKLKEDNGTLRLQYATTATVHVIPDYTPTLLEDVEGVNLKTLPVTLFNYDAVAWDEYYNNLHKPSETEGFFEFKSSSLGVPVTVDKLTNSINYSGWIMGIFEEELGEDGLPVMVDGYKVDLFSDNPISHQGTVGGKATDPAKEAYNTNMQFVYDPSTGYYTYASQLNAAQFFEDENVIKLYRENLSAADPGAAYQSNNAGFYPFVDVSKAFLNTAGSTGTGTLSYQGQADPTYKDVASRNTYPSDVLVSNNAVWLDKLDDGYAQYSGYLAKDLVSTYDESGSATVDMHFGMKLETQFYLPADKMINGQEIEYSFTGDDDLWVFIDGKLVLDIGGGHGPISGTINFTDGTVRAWNGEADSTAYSRLVKKDDGTYERTAVTGEYTNNEHNWEGDQMHTMSIFYLEKCSGHSNCYMRFNIPVVPSSSVLVSKTVENQDGLAPSVLPDTDYQFQLYTRTNSATEVGTYKPLANKEYSLQGVANSNATTDADGKFTLKAGQIAVFEGIDRFTQVYAKELNTDNYYPLTDTTVSTNGVVNNDYKIGDPSHNPDEKNAAPIIALDESIYFVFTNKLKTKPLTIEKEVVGGTEGLLNPNQEFSFDIVFADDCVVTDKLQTTGAVKEIAVSDKETESADAVHLGGSFKLKHGQSVTIPSVPVGMVVTLSEANPDTADNSFDAPVFAGTVCTAENLQDKFDTANAWTIGDGDNEIKVTNLQRFNLTISKTGFQSVDHDGTSRTDEEKQSAIFKVTGPNNYDADVVVCGNNSVTIKDLPVGNYTVKELTNWSWRYNATADTVAVDPDVYKETAAFENTRQRNLWLSGDNWIQNLLSANNIS